MACVILTAIQAVIWFKTAATPGEHLHQCLNMLYHACWMALAFLSTDRWWRRWHVTYLTLIRLTAAVAPSARSTQEGLGKFTLLPATPGWAGAALDFLRVSFGTRILGMSLLSVVLQLPPLAVLLQQSMDVALAADGLMYCRSLLLSSPLTQHRISNLWHAFNLIPTLYPAPPMTADQPTQDSGVDASTQAERRCMAVLCFHHAIIGMLLPTLAAAWATPLAAQHGTAHHLHTDDWTDARAAGAQQATTGGTTGAQQQQRQQRQHGGTDRKSVV